MIWKLTEYNAFYIGRAAVPGMAVAPGCRNPK